MTNKPDLSKVWAENADPSDIKNPDIDEAGKFQKGWLAEIPPHTWFNYIQNNFSSALAHFNEYGIAQWDTDTVYPVGGWARSTVDGEVYVALSAQSGNEPSASPVQWKAFSELFGITRPQEIELKSGRKNYIINGNFSINQRAFGGGQPAIGVYGYDRWKGDAAGTRIEQVVENYDSVNDSFVISWVGGTGTATVNGTSGLNSGDSFTLNTSGNFSVIVPTNATKIQLEKGSYATDFEYRPIAEELALCQRYFWKWLPLSNFDRLAAAVEGPNTNIMDGLYTLPTSMRAIPTINFQNLRIVYDDQSSSTTLNADAVSVNSILFTAAKEGTTGFFTGSGGTPVLEADAEL